MVFDVEEAGNFICPIMRLRKAPADLEEEMQDDHARHRVYGYCVGTDCAMFRHVTPQDHKDNQGYCGLAGRPYGLL
jgi:hypothetical protein